MERQGEPDGDGRRPTARGRLLLALPFLHFGVGRLALDLAAAAASRGWSIDVLTCGAVGITGDDPALLEEVRVLGGALHRADVFSRQPADMQTASAVVAAICRDRNIAFIHAFTAPAAAAGLDHRPVMASIVGWAPEKSGWQRAMDAAVLERCALVTAVSAAMRAEVQAAGLVRRDVRVIRNGVALGPSRDLTRADPTVRLTRIGVMAQLVARRGVDVLLRATVQLNPAIWQELIIAGTGEDEAHLRSLSALLPAARVNWAGIVSTQSFFERVDLVVVPSRSDALPMVLLQAMAYGRPVVASAVGGIPEAASHPDEVLLVEPDDPEALAGALTRTLSDPEAALRRCRAARQRIERDFSLAGTAMRYLECYAELSGEALSTDAVRPETPNGARALEGKKTD
jgi:glycosyltransferase involved in cell wall biosynthesis